MKAYLILNPTEYETFRKECSQRQIRHIHVKAQKGRYAATIRTQEQYDYIDHTWNGHIYCYENEMEDNFM